MSKPLLTPDEYLRELNSELQRSASYTHGMTFIAYPEGTSGAQMTGYSVTGPFSLTAIYAQVAQTVREQYDVLV